MPHQRVEIYGTIMGFIFQATTMEMKKVLLILMLALTANISLADPMTRKERREKRMERRLVREKFDNRSKEQKSKDFKIATFMIIAAVVVFKRMEDD